MAIRTVCNPFFQCSRYFRLQRMAKVPAGRGNENKYARGHPYEPFPYRLHMRYFLIIDSSVAFQPINEHFHRIDRAHPLRSVVVDGMFVGGVVEGVSEKKSTFVARYTNKHARFAHYLKNPLASTGKVFHQCG